MTNPLGLHTLPAESRRRGATAADPLALHVPAWLLALCLLLVFVGNLERSLWMPDEARVTAICVEMARTGDIWVPRLNGEPFVEKPPLFFIAGAGMIRVFGGSLGATEAMRLTVALFGLASLAFTYLLARRLFGPETGALALVLLATSLQFVHQYHWIRVDAALLTLVVASVWAFAEFYLAGRTWHLVLAGALTGTALLVKGLIGPALIFWAWLGLFVPWVFGRVRSRESQPLCVGFHVLALAALAGLAIGWSLAFYAVAGPDLWDELFWRNQLGRLTGTSGLGHERAEILPFFYVLSTVSYSLPWTPLLLVWLWRLVPALWQRRAAREDGLLVVWILGSLALLTLSTTKRTMYAFPLVPAYMLACTRVAASEVPRWCGGLFRWAVWAAVVAALLPLLVPVAARFIDLREVDLIRERSFLDVSPWLALSALAFGAALWVALRARDLSPTVRLAGAVAIVMILNQSVQVAAMERQRDPRSECERLVAAIPAGSRDRVAFFELSETQRGLVYLYLGGVVPRLKDLARVRRVLQGEDADFDLVLLGSRGSLTRLAPAPHTLLLEVAPGEGNRPYEDREHMLLVAPGSATTPAADRSPASRRSTSR